MQNKYKLIVAITGASGAIYGIRALELLKKLYIETHLIISKAAHITILSETEYSIYSIKELADFVYNPTDISARISSGSFRTNGMIIVPCSMKTLSAIANGYEENLISRAASVVMKEQKKLCLVIRETPLHTIHLDNMLKLSRYGVVINPAVPAFYNNPKTIDDLINHSLTRIFDIFEIDTKLIQRWNGINNL